MEKQLAQSIEVSENFWALYWYKRWHKQTHGLERAHLIAYLQEPCYWASHKAVQYLDKSQHSLSDCFQLLLTQIDKVLCGFQIDRGTSFRGYAKMALPSLIRDILRKRHDAHICSNWSLLRRVSKRQVTTALQQAGLSDRVVLEYRLAWMCYKACYVSSKSGQHKVSSLLQGQDWDAIAILYNQECLSQLSPPGNSITARMLEQRLTQTATWVRSLLYPPMESLNAPLSSIEGGGEWLDILSDDAHESLVGDLIAQEENAQQIQQQAALFQVLEEAIDALSPTAQQLLVAYYRGQLSQREIAEKLAIKQYTVSRRLSRIRESLLKTLLQWSHDALHISLSPNQVIELSPILEGWLDHYYSRESNSRDFVYEDGFNLEGRV